MTLKPGKPAYVDAGFSDKPIMPASPSKVVREIIVCLVPVVPSILLNRINIFVQLDFFSRHVENISKEFTQD